jgi:hypothetical protein
LLALHSTQLAFEGNDAIFEITDFLLELDRILRVGSRRARLLAPDGDPEHYHRTGRENRPLHWNASEPLPSFNRASGGMCTPGNSLQGDKNESREPRLRIESQHEIPP